MSWSIPVKALDERDGRLLVAPNLGWSDVPIVDELAARLGSSGRGTPQQLGSARRSPASLGLVAGVSPADLGEIRRARAG
jgi:hypothetical protein